MLFSFQLIPYDPESRGQTNRVGVASKWRLKMGELGFSTNLFAALLFHHSPANYRERCYLAFSLLIGIGELILLANRSTHLLCYPKGSIQCKCLTHPAQRLQSMLVCKSCFLWGYSCSFLPPLTNSDCSLRDQPPWYQLPSDITTTCCHARRETSHATAFCTSQTTTSSSKAQDTPNCTVNLGLCVFSLKLMYLDSLVLHQRLPWQKVFFVRLNQIQKRK